MSRSTLQGYPRAKNRKLKHLGRSEKIHYHVFHPARNAYLRLININYGESFSCSKCQDSPDVVIFDGITLGTMKDIPSSSIQIDEDQQLLPISQGLRMFIPSIANRKALLQYLQHGLPITAFQNLLQSLLKKFQMASHIKCACYLFLSVRIYFQ
ncbi:hypothetical protein LOD99_8425 [Oopsacas minuta]|uniref:Uncharacterized protein n=1 Tax=Oopsacas minuta TaxID=111878 RepID=A0AAV7JGA0_9METZ|nr:hypothetical protein LOD99_8425 [Oopsacas minuta]